jgi:hypothetical protein
MSKVESNAFASWHRLGAAALLLILSAIGTAARADEAADLLTWPPIMQQTKPWTYNWWPGSAVDEKNLTIELQQCHDAGLGGIHVIPIYGAVGAESRYIDFLSPRWLEMFGFTVKQAAKLDMGVDLTTGTGWCLGGPSVPRDEAGLADTVLTLTAPADGHIGKATGRKIGALLAISPAGARIDLTDKLRADGTLDWRPDAPSWQLYLLLETPRTIKVKRAAPGGVGFMINPFYGKAMTDYLARFTNAFAPKDVVRPRAMYQDSYEYRGDWSPDLLDEFARRRGYRLQDELDVFAGNGDPDSVARVRDDYRRTVSDMMVENVFSQWVAWCHERGMLVRYQAHGSPGNLVDLYALADIPETEMFGRGDENPLISQFDEHIGDGARDPLISKFASSAAHVAGRQLVSSETGTWMAEHFCETLEELKCVIDRLFVSGINHVFYHGCCYSPADAAWPGWVFYAATEMNPRNSIWHDVPTLNAYIARCQSVLQSGASDNDVLLYWPIDDLWMDGTPGLHELDVEHRDWLNKQPIGATARALWTGGYGFDYVSDRFLQSAKTVNRQIVMPGGSYRVIVVPPTHYIPLATLQKLVELFKSGGRVIFDARLPSDVPGLAHLDESRQQVKSLLADLPMQPATDLDLTLNHHGVRGEEIASKLGAMFVRRSYGEKNEGGHYYFVVNQTMATIDGWASLATPAKSVILMDPMTGAIGLADTRAAEAPADGYLSVHVRLEPAQSIILKTVEDKQIHATPFVFDEPGTNAQTLPGPWNVRFIAGGPTLPRAYQMSEPQSWTLGKGPALQSFGGTAIYSTVFDAPAGGDLELDLGRVCNSARVRVNNNAVGTLIMRPYRLRLSAAMLKPTGNQLKIEVTNLSANRIRDLDRRHVAWRIFHDINFVSISYKPFDASNWPVMDSGLLGPVTISPR